MLREPEPTPDTSNSFVPATLKPAGYVALIVWMVPVVAAVNWIVK